MIPAVQLLYWLSVTVAQATELSRTASEAMARGPRTLRRGMRKLQHDALLLSTPSRSRATVSAVGRSSPHGARTSFTKRALRHRRGTGMPASG